MTPKVAVIGAGLAGLTAAHRLLSRGIEVTVIDKGRHGGGRMCTRNERLPDGRTARFDIGPPILYARLASRVRGWSNIPMYRVASLAAELHGGSPFAERVIGRIGAADEVVSALPITGLAARGGMRELPFRLLTAHHETLTFRDHTLVETLERTESGWRIHIRSLRDDDRTIISANAIVLTPPVPQTLELLANSRIELPDDLRDALRRVTYSCCIAVYGVFTGADELQPGGVWFGDEPFEWITDNHRKEVSTVPNSITALTTHEWAAMHWEEPDARLLELLLPPLHSWVGTPIDSGCVWVHRWKWAKPRTPIRPPCALVRDLAMVIAGDGFAEAVPDAADAAVASGEAAALRMAALLTALARKDDRYTVARPRHYTLEIAVSTPDEAAAAGIHGADRLELSCGLDLGGLTPSMGLFRAVHERVNVPVYVMLRPRPGGFAYSPHEYAVMQADAEAFLAEGATGIVFAILTPNGRIDHGRCRALVDLANGKAVFHRAFDFLSDPFVALEELIDLGFERVLTSGGATTAEAGTTRLTALVQHAGWQIEVLPAGNIRPHNVADLVRATRCDQVHSAARVNIPDPLFTEHAGLAQGLGGGTGMDAQLVSRLRDELDLLNGSLS